MSGSRSLLQVDDLDFEEDGFERDLAIFAGMMEDGGMMLWWSLAREKRGAEEIRWRGGYGMTCIT